MNYEIHTYGNAASGVTVKKSAILTVMSKKKKKSCLAKWLSCNHNRKLPDIKSAKEIR